MNNLNLTGKSVFISGANRGLGKALLEQLIEKGVSRIYAGSRKIENLKPLEEKYGDKIVSIELDVTSKESISKATGKVDQLDVLINNAGTMSPGSLISDEAIDSLESNFNVNVWGAMRLTNAFQEHFEGESPSVIANIISVAGFGNMPSLGGYSVSKAAIHSATQGMRAQMAPHNTNVIGVYPGPMDTDMVAGWDLEKANPTEVAENIIKGIENGAEYIFPDNQSQMIGDLYFKDPKSVEANFAQMI